ncbi:uncharacterized protein BDCG_16822 [Blastomyces dermatitidis ER-3]|uniref:Uncharacterized protein n=2 Tax=Blastomyces TaxID=229219 RepID=A0A179UAM5_BLAGS|nr:uncharacterized protein BDBG_16239 [Blastomyces gilchristii SLH14081]XP_045280690.1 uncharacterized protein BDCG_16822 [Blastomyces dermatitidis ER-3]OAT00963.1 hypothetical protein BDCG_16822 [Blastomyces dermatitidis ER-3]OAT04358.1 hypothetical protein BDBG_16239 [Blastomyces gilchristii SLH14081]
MPGHSKNLSMVIKAVAGCTKRARFKCMRCRQWYLGAYPSNPPCPGVWSNVKKFRNMLFVAVRGTEYILPRLDQRRQTPGHSICVGRKGLFDAVALAEEARI